MKDAAPELYAQLMTAFETKTANDPLIKSFNKKLEAGKATQEQCSQYAGRLGEIAAEACAFVLVPENLPDGILYWNIATRTILPMLKRVHELVNTSAIQIQKIEDEKAGLGLIAQPAPFPEARVNDLLNSIVEASKNWEVPKIE